MKEGGECGRRKKGTEREREPCKGWREADCGKEHLDCSERRGVGIPGVCIARAARQRHADQQLPDGPVVDRQSCHRRIAGDTGCQNLPCGQGPRFKTSMTFRTNPLPANTAISTKTCNSLPGAPLCLHVLFGACRVDPACVVTTHNGKQGVDWRREVRQVSCRARARAVGRAKRAGERPGQQVDGPRRPGSRGGAQRSRRLPC